MTAQQFASLLSGRRTGRGKWVAKCPSHPDRSPSLHITEGKSWSVVFECMSQHCDRASILDAMGLTWSDISRSATMTPEVRQRVADQERLKKLEYRHGWIIMGKILNPDKPWYWLSAESEIEQDIYRLRGKLGAVR